MRELLITFYVLMILTLGYMFSVALTEFIKALLTAGGAH